ncbi:MAG: coproporphyrinogen III oxidase [Desulfobacter postgatei]|uniref:Coproporphyrinogen III oxidase n=1 Tax=Desulfobacter postgatei TaxID=2293 RepID=A0A2G6MTE7_9BACT|nr:MAG: coproporphyrinogen III oxidase [Desulfobacter postgatei]
MADDKQTQTYQGYEQGPISAVNDPYSLLLRLIRNCPWNRCAFCPIHKKQKFSIRPVEDIIKDIDLVRTYIDRLRKENALPIAFDQERIHSIYSHFEVRDRVAFNNAVKWSAAGMTSIFLQDANPLIMKPKDLLFILRHIKERFPQTKTIATYARSSTILQLSHGTLEQLHELGLKQIHLGLESGSNLVLNRMRKGADRFTHIEAGKRIRQAGIELYAYVMPGLGGVDLSIEHALETAEALNAIHPDVIKIRTLGISPSTELAHWQVRGMFEKPGDAMIATEVRLMLEALDNIKSRIKSDHILNLFETVTGEMPHDKEKMIGVIDQFFELGPQERILYQIGRRMGFFKGLEDMDKSPRMDQVRLACENYGVTPKNVDQILDRLMMRFV